jgi:hypothetical protein
MADAVIYSGNQRRNLPGILKFEIWDQEFKMFDGKNNRILDSLSFRLALMAAVFAVWSGAGYLLLAL